MATVGLTDAQSDVSGKARAESGAKTRTLKITVLDKTTNQPVEGATVGAPVIGVQKLTDATGQVVLSIPPEARQSGYDQSFNINVSHPHFASREVMWISDPGNVRESLDDAYVFRIQPGMTVGGYVRDERGKAVANATVTISGSDYRGFQLGSGIKEKQEYASLNNDDASIETDKAGFWRRGNVPSDLAQIQIVVTRPDGGSRTKFVTPAVHQYATNPVVLVSDEDLKAEKVILLLKEGMTLRGSVTNETGESLNGVRLRVRSASRDAGNELFETRIDGHFELPHWTASRVIVTAECAGYATTSVTLEPIIDMPEAHLMMRKAKGLKVRVVGENNDPLSGVHFRIVQYRSGEQLVDWDGETNAEGRITWSDAPEMPVTYAIIAQDYLVRTAQFSADGTEHLVRLKKGKGDQITFALKVIDAKTSQPLEQFDVLRRTSGSYELWGAPGSQGAFAAELPLSLFRKGSGESYRVQVRAPGYGAWTSDRLEFSDGDQLLTAKLEKGISSTNTGIGTSYPLVVTNSSTDPALLPVGTAVVQLLETQDVSAFVHALSPTLEDWKDVLPPGLDAMENPLGKKPQRRIHYFETALTSSAKRVLELAKRIELTKNQLQFTVKSMVGAAGGSRGYTLKGKKLEIPFLPQLRIVLTAHPAESAAQKTGELREYVLDLGDLIKLPSGWRVEKGIRWVNFPLELADETTLRDLELLQKITATDFFTNSGPITGFDDEALNQVALNVIELLRRRDTTTFANVSTLSRKGLEEFLAKRSGRSASEAETENAYHEMNMSVAAVATSLLHQLDQLGIELSDAQITTKRVTAESVETQEFGSLEGAHTRSLKITLAVTSPHASRSGAALSGDYSIVFQNMIRVGGHWIITEPKARWAQFPSGLLAEGESKAVALENYIVENHSLPPGTTAPDIDLFSLTDLSSIKLSAFRGKIVILDFWASWCPPCQEPMREMQTLTDRHPGWRERVEIVSISIDDTVQQASDHLTKQGWNKSQNRWAGDGGFKSKAAQIFRLEGVPTTYVIGVDGKILAAGHPVSMNFASIVDNALR